MDDGNALLAELMAVFDALPASLRDAINYAPEALDPKSLAALCRRHGAANVLAMIELRQRRAAGRTAGRSGGRAAGRSGGRRSAPVPGGRPPQ